MANQFEDLRNANSLANLPSTATGLPVYEPVAPFVGGAESDVNSMNLSFDDMMAGIRTSPKGAAPISASDIYTGERYSSVFPYRDPEEMHAQQQSIGSKWLNGIGKLAGTTSTAFLNGTAGLVYGLGSWINTGKFSSLYNNSVTRSLDEINKKMEDALPNYYAQAEKDASWYSMDNVLTANFWSDKVLKNLGYSIGSMGAGFAWGQVFKALQLTNALVRAGQGLETVQAIDTAIATAPKAAKFGEFMNVITGLSKKLQPIAATVLTNADRGLISVMGTMGEAGFEAIQNANSYRDRLINEYKQQYGVAPVGEDLAEINSYADKIGNFTWGMNVALLTATNYIQLPKILSSSRIAEKRLMNNVVKEGLEEGATIMEKTAAKYKVAPTIAERIAGSSGRFFDKYLIKPASLFVSPVEGFEEGAQYAIQTGTEDYFERAQRDKKDVNSFWENLSGTMQNVFTHGVKETLTEKEGLESILIGAISGGIQTSFSPFGENTVKERGIFGTGGKKAKNTSLAIDVLNKSKNLTQVLKDGIKYNNIGIVSQKLRNQAIVNDDKLAEKDYEQDFTLSYIMPRVKYGKLDSIEEELKLYEYQAMNPSGFQDLQNSQIVLPGETREQFLERLANIKKVAKQVNKNYEMFNDKFSTIVNDKGERRYDNTVIDKLVYSAAKTFDYDDRLKNLSNKLTLNDINTDDLLNSILESNDWKENKFHAVADDPAVNTSINSIFANIDSKKPINSDELKQDVVDFADMILKREYFVNEYQSIRNNPEDFQEKKEEIQQEEDKTPSEKKETITIKTKTGDKSIVTNEEYLLGRVVEYDKDGNEVYRAPKLVILGENEDGTIKIKDNNGIRDISKQKLEDYKLVKASSVKDNKKLNYFMQNWNTVYTHHGIKDKNGKSVQGILEYSEDSNKLIFVYKDDRGKLQKREVVNTMFKAKKGFAQPMIFAAKTLTAVQKAAETAFVEDKLTMSEQLQARNNVITNLYNRSVARVEEINNKLQKNKETLEKNKEVIKNILETKKGMPRKNITQVMKRQLKELADMQSNIERQNVLLEEEKSELEYNIPMFKEFMDNVDTLSENGKDIVDMLQKDVDALEKLIENIDSTIGANNQLLDEIKATIQASVEALGDYVARLQRENPNIPLFLEDFQNSLEKYYGEEGAKQFIADRLGFTDLIAELEDSIRSYEDQLNFPELKQKQEKLIEKIDILQGRLDKVIAKQIAKSKILEAFKEFADNQERERIEEEEMQRNEMLKEQYIGTLDSDVQSVLSTVKYEPASKKEEMTVVSSTRPIDDGKAHQQRANFFGFNFNKFKNKDNIKGVIVTSKTEEDIIPGLTEYLLSEATEKQKQKYKANEIIAMVMVQDNEDGTLTLVDRYGKPIPKNDEKGDPINPLNEAIFQTFPMDDLMGYYYNDEGVLEYGTMFRDTVNDDVKKQLEQQYSAWRTSKLAETKLSAPEEIKVSFGILEYPGSLNDKGKFVRDTSARIPATETGLITPNMLIQNKVLIVATTNETITSNDGSVSFTTPKGRVFLRPEFGMAKLFNRKFSEKEANTIFDVILQVTKNGMKKGEVTEETQILIDWLKSVVYWGFAKDMATGKRKPAGYNNIWFEEVTEDDQKVSKLFISGITKDSTRAFLFTPTGLMNHKNDIIYLLTQLYHNTNATRVNKSPLTKKYYQITGIKEDGTPKTIEWPNYQSYLLSDKMPDPSKDGQLLLPRENADIPLVTQARPLKDSEDVNRKGIYFIRSSAPNEFVVKKAEKKAKPAKKEEAPKAPKANTASVAPVAFDLSGKTENTIPVKLKEETIGNLVFTVDAEKFKETQGQEGLNMMFDTNSQSKSLLDTLMGRTGLPRDKAELAILGILWNKYDLGKRIDAYTIPENLPITDTTPAPEVKEPEKAEEKVEEAPAAPEEDAAWEDFTPTDDSEVLREKVTAELNSLKTENWTEVEKWLKSNFPNIPVYRVKNIIKATNGREAWGMLQNGAIYIYENAEVGTAYHEVFEAVWKMFAGPEEKQNIINEFRSRKGSFTDRFSISGRKIEYKNATDQEIKEELAEEFRDFVMFKKVPVKSEGKSLIARIFQEIVDFIKAFFTGEKAMTNTEQLFERIGNGYYSKYNPYASKLSFAQSGIIDIDEAIVGNGSEFRQKVIPGPQMHDIIQHMTYLTLANMVRSNESLFEIPGKEKISFYDALRDGVRQALRNKGSIYEENIRKSIGNKDDNTRELNNIKQLFGDVSKNWEEIVDVHREKIKAFGLDFDENDEPALTSEEKSKEDGFGDARKIDSFRKANGAIKLLLGSLCKVGPVTVKNELNQSVVTFKPLESSIGGRILLPADSVYINLLNELHTSTNLDDMLLKLRALAVKDRNYEALYSRLTKVGLSELIDYSALKEDDWHLLTAFWKSMKKQNADVVTVFILPSGEVVVSDSTLSDASKQAKRDILNSMVDKIKEGTVYFDYDKKTGKYSATDALKKVKFTSSQLEQYVKFLGELNIHFNLNDLKTKIKGKELNLFREAVEGIQESLSKIGTPKLIDGETVDTSLVLLTSKTMDIDKRLTQLGLIKAIIDRPETESTYFNINGERTQSYVGTNAISNLFTVLSKLKNIDDLENKDKGYSGFSYLRTDKFAKGSVLLQRMFDLREELGDGQRIEGTENLLKPVFVDGIVDEEKGRKKEASKLTYKQRLIQEINLNTSGIYLNLVPGDASIEHAAKMHDEDNPFVSKEDLQNETYLRIFRDYFMSEVELARDKNRRVVSDKNAKDLRFFKAILGEELHDKIMAKANQKYSASELYNGTSKFKGYKNEIDNAVREFVKKEALDTESLLRSYEIIQETSEGTIVENLLFAENMEITPENLNTSLKLLALNYMIANIEFHKLLYSDPYQYSDELKRIKNFNSPRQPLMTVTDKLMSAFNVRYNRGYREKGIGYTDMNRDYFNSITLADIFSTNELKGYEYPFEEPEGGGYITLSGLRLLKILAGEWNSSNERQYRYDIAYEKYHKGKVLNEDEIEIFDPTERGKDNPNVKDTYTPIKPIVSGNKDNGRDYNDVVLHKFSLVPLSYRLMHKLNPESNMIKLYDKMQREKVDYAVYESGSKVGSEKLSTIYNPDGSFNEEPFQTKEELKNVNLPQGITRIPFSIISIQSEVPSKDVHNTTMGSQITKLATMDYMEAGVPIDFEIRDEKGKIIDDINERVARWKALDNKEEHSELYKEIMNNQRLLEEQIKEGYISLLKKFGIKKTKAGFNLVDRSKLIKTLREEILKREVNDNILDAFSGFEKGDVILEATPAYQQIRNILYSIADKNVVSRKISGGMKVQIPSTFLESTRKAARLLKTKKGKDQLSFDSDILKFYVDKDGQRVCEVMVGRWFKSNKTDEELMRYFNEDPEGKKQLSALMGVGFRIPTQKQNSIDVFKIAKFLPEEYGDSIVIPSALVKKSGSDFDIDKLSIYLKNLYEDNQGNLKVVPFLGYGEQAKEEFGKMYDRGDFLTKKQFADLQKELEEEREKTNPEYNLIRGIFGELGNFTEEEITEFFIESVTKEGFREKLIDKMYKESLENAYIESLERLISHPRNFENLIKPNSADQMKDLAKKINRKLNRVEKSYSDPGNMLNRSYMSNLRHSFVSGKYAIGIAAVAQTNHTQNQRSLTYIDSDVLLTDRVSEIDKAILGGNDQTAIFANNPDVNFQEYNSVMVNGRRRPTLSMIKDALGINYISDIIGQFIDGYVDISKGPWIMELGATQSVTSTWLFLIKLGVPVNTVTYFMNQPIIREYLQSLENKGYSWLFISNYIIDALDNYSPKEGTVVPSVIPGETELYDMVGKKSQDMTDLEKSQQQYMLKEFLKYAKMANQLFVVTQGSNYDTATINDPYLIFKKKIQLDRARNTVISSVDNLLNDSFVGELKKTIEDVREALTEILISDRPRIRTTLEGVLERYVDMSDKEFIKVSRKAVNDLFDWAVQVNTGLSSKIERILLGKDTEESAAKQIIEFKEKVLGNPAKGIPADTKHPLYNNAVLRAITLESGIRKRSSDVAGKPNNISLKGRDNKIYDQNMLIYGFHELKKEIGKTDPALYGKLVRLAVLQSGLTNSPIAFTNLLPYEDFKEVYNTTLSALEEMPNLDNFRTAHVFERNNWNNDDIVPTYRDKVTLGKEDPRTGYKSTYYKNQYFVDSNLKNAMKKGVIPMVVNIPTLSSEGRHDFIVYTWEEKLSKAKKINARRTGDRSHIHKVLMKKVYFTDENGKYQPLIQRTEDKKSGIIYEKFIYKAMNAWGDSFRAQEFYDKIDPLDASATVARPSVLNNDFEKVVRKVDEFGNQLSSNEVEDDTIIYYMRNRAENQVAKATPSPSEPQTKPATGTINIFAGTGENANLSNFAERPFLTKSSLTGKNVKFKTVEGAFQAAKLGYANISAAEHADIEGKLMKATGEQAKKIGRDIKNLDVAKWNENSYGIMKRLLKESFAQNPFDAIELLQTGQATLTHTQGAAPWNTLFPKALMEVRNEMIEVDLGLNTDVEQDDFKC